MRIDGQDGSVAKVTQDGRLHTSASVYSEDHEAALDSDAYVVDIDAVDVNGAEHIVVIKNTDDDPMVVTSVVLWVNEFKADCVIEVNLNETFTYAANGTALTPINMRSGVAGGADCIVYEIAAGGTDITTFGGTATKGGRFVFTILPMKWVKDSGWVIPKNQVFSLYHDGAGRDNVYRGYISFYFHRSCNEKHTEKS